MRNIKYLACPQDGGVQDREVAFAMVAQERMSGRRQVQFEVVKIQLPTERH